MHEVDEIGLPVDPKLREIQFRLGDIVGKWAKYESPERQAELVQEYHATVQLLYELGWDGEIAFESQLPDELMPEEYMKRNPPFYPRQVRYGDKIYRFK